MTPPAPARRGPAAGVAMLAVVVAAALRFYGVWCPYVHPHLQEQLPTNAIVSIVRGDWRPLELNHGSALIYALRVLYLAWYAIGRSFGGLHDAWDLLSAYAHDPLPFLVAGRVLVASTGVIAVYLVWRLGDTCFGPAVGSIAALVLAVAPAHVRLSKEVWFDGPAALMALLSVAVSVRLWRARTWPWLWLAGACGGIAVATKFSVFPVLLSVAVAAALAGERKPLAIVGRLIEAGLSAILAFAILSPYTFLDPAGTLTWTGFQAGAFAGPRSADTLPLAILLRTGLGWGTVLCALVGLVAGVVQAPGEAGIVAAFAVPYALALATGSGIFARYLAPLAPFTALFAAVGIATMGRMLAPSRSVLGITAVALVVVLPTAWSSVRYTMILAEDDTRVLAGRWLAAHVSAGTSVTFPDVTGYANPVVPLDPLPVHLGFDDPEVVADRIGSASDTYPVTYLPSALNGAMADDWRPETSVVVTASHPAVGGWFEVPEIEQRLVRLGALRQVQFEGVRVPLADGVVYDVIDADFMPLAGFTGVTRPGPNITIWTWRPAAPLDVPHAPGPPSVP